MSLPTSLDELKQAAEELELYLRGLRVRHGAALYEMKNADGKSVVEPILVALVNARTAILNHENRR